MMRLRRTIQLLLVVNIYLTPVSCEKPSDNINGDRVIVSGVIKLEYPSDVRLILLAANLFESDYLPNKLMVRYDYEIQSRNKATLYVFLRPKLGSSSSTIQSKLSGLSPRKASTNFGIGSEYDLIQNSERNGVSIISNDEFMIRRMITSWGGIAKDLLVYTFPIETDLFDYCMIEVLNPISREYYEKWKRFDVNTVMELLAKGDNDVNLIHVVDKIIDSLVIVP